MKSSATFGTGRNSSHKEYQTIKKIGKFGGFLRTLGPTVDGDEGATLSSLNSRNHPVPRGSAGVVKGTGETIAAWVYVGS